MPAAVTLPAGNPAHYVVEDGQFVVSFGGSPGTTTYRVDPEALLVTGFVVADSSGATLLEMRSSRLQSYDGFSLPRRVDLRVPAKDSEMVITFTTQRPNDPAPSFVYSIPRNARRVER